jgi:hypothetical protein
MHTAVLLSLLLSACAGGSGSESAAQTAAVGTLDAQLANAQGESALQTAEAENAQLQATVDALATQNAELQIESTSTAQAAATSSAIAPQIVSSDAAVCRTGPNAGFAKVFDLDANQPYDVFGRSLDGEWWQLASPAGGGATCWVFWDDDLDFLGEVFNLPMLAGPALPTATFGPTPAPGIAVRFVDTLTCGGVRYAIVLVRNLGTETYQSALVKLHDQTTDTALSQTDGNNEFLRTSSTCPKGDPELGPLREAYVAVPIKNTVSGNSLFVRVTVCTEKGLGGICCSSAAQFTN